MREPSASFDVVIVGTQLGPLVAGALLAKRGFRVLLIGQDDLPASYDAGIGLPLARGPFTFLPAHSPVARKVLAELALHPLVRRRTHQVDPAFQVVLPGHRFDVPLDEGLLSREVEREFPAVKRLVDDFLAGLAERDEALDRVLARDLTWPPQTFLERRELAAAAGALPYGRHGDALDPLAEFPESHPFRLAVELPARFSDGMDPDHGTGIRRSRHFAAWRRGGAVLAGGYQELRELLLGSLDSHSAVVQPRDRIDRILLRRGTAVGVRLAASGEVIGATSVIVGSTLGQLLSLVPERGPFEELFERIGEPVVRYFRYTLNLVVAAEGLPPAIARDVFFVRRLGRPLSDVNALHLQVDPVIEGRRRVVVEALVPRRGVEEVAEYAVTLRERLLRSLETLLPFLRPHLLLVDSPHDGRDILDLRAGVSRAPAEPWTRGPQTMEPVYGFPVATALGVCALPVRTPIRRLYLCNRQVVPGLGLEGEFLAAHSAARVVAKADRKLDWMRRSRWRTMEA